MIVDSNGLIITNNHVVNKADEIRVILSDKREFKGKLIGTDTKTDVAIVKIEATGLSTIPLADSDQLEVGEFVLAVGSPFGLTQSVTMGIVSAVGRASMGIAEYEDFIQTDAAINPGNSGGALGQRARGIGRDQYGDFQPERRQHGNRVCRAQQSGPLDHGPAGQDGKSGARLAWRCDSRTDAGIGLPIRTDRYQGRVGQRRDGRQSRQKGGV